MIARVVDHKKESLYIDVGEMAAMNRRGEDLWEIHLKSGKDYLVDDINALKLTEMWEKAKDLSLARMKEAWENMKEISAAAAERHKRARKEEKHVAFQLPGREDPDLKESREMFSPKKPALTFDPPPSSKEILSFGPNPSSSRMPFGFKGFPSQHNDHDRWAGLVDEHVRTPFTPGGPPSSPQE